MLCEGIFLYIYLNFLFYDGFFVKWYFFLSVGWGKLKQCNNNICISYKMGKRELPDIYALA